MEQWLYEAGSRHRVTLGAARVTFYGPLAIFPAIAVLLSVYVFLADPVTSTSQVQWLSTLFPGGAKSGAIDAEPWRRAPRVIGPRLERGVAL